MNFITEDVLREAYKIKPFIKYEIEKGSRLTPGARQFLQDRQINVFEDGTTMHVGDGLVGYNEKRNTFTCAFEKRILNARVNATKALFMLTAIEIMKSDICIAKEIMDLGDKFYDIKDIMDRGSNPESAFCKECTGMNKENFSCDLGECFEITNFHAQAEKGNVIILLHRLRSDVFETQALLMELQDENKVAIERINQIINRLSQMICITFGGKECQRMK